MHISSCLIQAGYLFEMDETYAVFFFLLPCMLLELNTYIALLSEVIDALYYEKVLR